MTKYKKIIWGFEPTDDVTCLELPQRIAFTFGYNWETSTIYTRMIPMVITNKNFRVGFDPNRKLMNLVKDYKSSEYLVVWTGEFLIKVLNNPPLNPTVIKSTDGKLSVHIEQDNVVFVDNDKLIQISVPNKLVRQTAGLTLQG